MSAIVFAVVCVLTISFTSAQNTGFQALVCKESLCNMCQSRNNNNIWCTICSCSTFNQDLCSNVRCGDGRVCEIAQSRGWFARKYATCVEVEKTTTTTTTTAPRIINGGVECQTRADCESNEICQIVGDQVLGTCVRKSSKCFEEKRSGPCRAGFRKYFYNTVTAKCEGFFYGGCNPSENNFDSMEECEQECETETETEVKTVDPCSLPKHPGICRAILVQYYYNKDSGKCEEFQYGGCGGNENRWDERKKCQDKCENRGQA